MKIFYESFSPQCLQTVSDCATRLKQLGQDFCEALELGIGEMGEFVLVALSIAFVLSINSPKPYKRQPPAQEKRQPTTKMISPTKKPIWFTQQTIPEIIDAIKPITVKMLAMAFNFSSIFSNIIFLLLKHIIHILTLRILFVNTFLKIRCVFKKYSCILMDAML